MIELKFVFPFLGKAEFLSEKCQQYLDKTGNMGPANIFIIWVNIDVKYCFNVDEK